MHRSESVKKFADDIIECYQRASVTPEPKPARDSRISLVNSVV